MYNITPEQQEKNKNFFAKFDFRGQICLTAAGLFFIGIFILLKSKNPVSFVLTDKLRPEDMKLFYVIIFILLAAGILLVALAVVKIVLTFTGKATHEELEECINGYKNAVKEISKQKTESICGEASEAMLLFTSSVKNAQKKDGISEKYKISAINFFKEKFFIFEYKFSLTWNSDETKIFTHDYNEILSLKKAVSSTGSEYIALLLKNGEKYAVEADQENEKELSLIEYHLND